MAGEVWNGLEQNIINTAINKWRKHLCACVRVMGQRFYSRQSQKNGQLDELSAKVTEMWTKCFCALF